MSFLLRYAVFKVRCFLSSGDGCFSSPTDRNGDEGIRTLDPLLARQVLSQLSYTPVGIPEAVRV